MMGALAFQTFLVTPPFFGGLAASWQKTYIWPTNAYVRELRIPRLYANNLLVQFFAQQRYRALWDGAKRAFGSIYGQRNGNVMAIGRDCQKTASF